MKLFVPLTVVCLISSPVFAQCPGSSVQGTQSWEYDPGIGSYLPIPIQIVSALVRQCPEASISWLGVDVSADFSDGSNNGHLSLELSGQGAIQQIYESILSGDPPLPEISFGNCPLFAAEEAIVEARGSHSLYTFHVGQGYYKQRAEGTFFACDTVSVRSPVATYLEVPVRIHGSVLAAESFGDQPTTKAVARLSIEGTIDGQAIGPFAIEVESITVIPEQASIDQIVEIQIPVAAGVTVFDYELSGEWYVQADAKGTGLFGLIAGAATALVDFPSTIRVGNFRGVGGADLPMGIDIRSALDGKVYTPATSGASLCVPTSNSTGQPAHLELSGSPLLSDQQLAMAAASCPAGQVGIFLYGGDSTHVPFGNGLLCVTAGSTGIRRFPPMSIDTSGRMSQEVDFASGAGSHISSGQTHVFQAWYRDPAAGGAAFNLSDAIAILLIP